MFYFGCRGITVWILTLEEIALHTFVMCIRMGRLVEGGEAVAEEEKTTLYCRWRM